MRPGNREHVSHVAMHTPRTPLHLGRPSRVQRYSSSMHRAMKEDSWMIRNDDDDRMAYSGYASCSRDIMFLSKSYDILQSNFNGNF